MGADAKEEEKAGTPDQEPVSQPPSEAEFLEKNSRLVYNLALRLVGNPVDAEDLAQDALIRALKALPNFRGDSAQTTWVYRITVNAWKNRVRSEKRRSFWKTLPLHALFGSGEEEEDRNTEGALAADDPSLDAGLETEETVREVHKALQGLDEENRAVVILRDIKGLSYQAIGETLGLPEGTVKSKLSRARNALAIKLRKYANNDNG
ncbi:MAG: RNA polymerase subunit sigma-24 [Elusimicrobia bacterium]|nr:MAG: RNA polymerase subunit sigma-24 [Elusimicrobiota bacterium]